MSIQFSRVGILITVFLFANLTGMPAQAASTSECPWLASWDDPSATEVKTSFFGAGFTVMSKKYVWGKPDFIDMLHKCGQAPLAKLAANEKKPPNGKAEIATKISQSISAFQNAAAAEHASLNKLHRMCTIGVPFMKLSARAKACSAVVQEAQARDQPRSVGSSSVVQPRKDGYPWDFRREAIIAESRARMTDALVSAFDSKLDPQLEQCMNGYESMSISVSSTEEVVAHFTKPIAACKHVQEQKTLEQMIETVEFAFTADEKADIRKRKSATTTKIQQVPDKLNRMNRAKKAALIVTECLIAPEKETNEINAASSALANDMTAYLSYLKKMKKMKNVAQELEAILGLKRKATKSSQTIDDVLARQGARCTDGAARLRSEFPGADTQAMDDKAKSFSKLRAENKELFAKINATYDALIAKVKKSLRDKQRSIALYKKLTKACVSHCRGIRTTRVQCEGGYRAGMTFRRSGFKSGLEITKPTNLMQAFEGVANAFTQGFTKGIYESMPPETLEKMISAVRNKRSFATPTLFGMSQQSPFQMCACGPKNRLPEGCSSPRYF